MIAGAPDAIPRTLEELIPPDLAARLDRLDVLSRKVLSGKMPGERRSKRRGRSVEFDDFRPYVPGDDLRHIDWNILARLDKLVIKLFREEEDLALHLVVDASGSMDAGKPHKGVYAHRLAMALASVGLANQNRVTVGAFGHGQDESGRRGPGGLRQLAPMRGRRNLQRVGAFLLDSLRAPRSAVTQPPGAIKAEFDAAMRVLGRTRAGKGIMVIMSDLFVPGGVGDGLAYVGGGAGFDTYAVQLLSPGELDPTKDQERGLIGDVRLTDVETGRAAEVTISPVAIARYRQALEQQIQRTRTACMARGVAHFLVSTGTPVSDLVLGTLRRGGLLR